MNVIFIAALDHSGSTVLEAFLSGFKNCLGIGEAYNMFSHMLSLRYDALHFKQNNCSCGQVAGECPFWKDVLERFASPRPPSTMTECYQIVMRQAEIFMGPDVRIIDSSKYVPALSFLSETMSSDENLSVIHLARDIRSWTSNRRRRFLLLKDTGKFPLKRKIKAQPVFLFRTWLRFNNRLHACIMRNKLDSINLGYEEFCFSLDNVRNLFCMKYGLSDKGKLGENMHNIVGNIVRGNQIQYDYRWLTDNSWKIPMFVMPDALRANTKFVYSNNF